jgi:8-oxo-dGTP pyrophosphatase MutT (NUDIX family)
MSGNKYKIFIDEKPLIILPQGSAEQNVYGSETLNWKGKQTVDDALEKIRDAKTYSVIIRAMDSDVAFHQCASRFKVVEAAGGVVKNNSGQYLFIFRRGKWDLPKGKMDDGESVVETAMREVNEECGLDNLKILSPLINTYHFYPEKKNNILKRTYWFLMSTDDTEVQIEREEGIENFVWLEKEKILSHISSNTFPNILELINESLAKL